MHYLIHDGNSLGYDFRDFEAVVDFAKRHQHDSITILTRATNIELFASTLSGSNIVYVGYSKYSEVPTAAQLAKVLGIPTTHIISFIDTNLLVNHHMKTSGGILLPDGVPYLRVIQSLIEGYVDQLRAMVLENQSLHTVFAIVSGEKPVSDVGNTLTQQLEEGRRQTYPLDCIADVAKALQERLAAAGVALIPLCVQYGDCSKVSRHLQHLNKQKDLPFPIRIIEDVDWNNHPLQQAACYVAMKRVSEQFKAPIIAFGNASTYLHLILASVGQLDAIAVAVHGYPITHSRDGRSYWEEVGQNVTFLRTFSQSTPGVWNDVTYHMVDYLSAQILIHLDIIQYNNPAC